MKDAEQLLREKHKIKIDPTPGPWFQSHVQDKKDGMYYTRVYDHKDIIATLHWYPIDLGDGVTGTRREANAKLIAAAPDMLKALQTWQAANALGDALLLSEARIKRDAAIKKATE